MKLLLGIFAVLIAVVNCLPRDQFFPFGEGTADKKLNRRSKKPLTLSFREPFTFLGEEQSLLYVSLPTWSNNMQQCTHCVSLILQGFIDWNKHW